jgi:peptidoglycan/LPS O-acetylase OafA/YrhL
MRRIAELDGLRGVSALLIVAYHLFEKHLLGCWAALHIFFVLSGYLITSIVIQHELSWQFLWNFYLRRSLRIWPIYYLLIILLTFVGLRSTEALPYYLTCTQRLPLCRGGDMPTWPALQHAWSLAAEEQCYLIWPVVALLAGTRPLGYLALAFALIGVGARHAGFDIWTLAGRCEGFALGGFLASNMADTDRRRASQAARNWMMVFGVLLIVELSLLLATGRLFPGTGVVTMAGRVTLATLGSAILVTFLVSHSGHPVLTFCDPLRSFTWARSFTGSTSIIGP